MQTTIKVLTDIWWLSILGTQNMNNHSPLVVDNIPPMMSQNGGYLNTSFPNSFPGYKV